MKRYPLNDGWYFTEQFTRQLTTLEKPEPELVPVRLPHTVKLLPFNDFSEQAYQMVSGYLRFLVPPESWRGQRVRVVFEGVAHQARVYLNGQLLAQHACGYTAFTVDLTDHLHWQGANNLTVELDSRENLDVPPFGNVIDYLTYGGLYREVFLEVGGPALIEDLCVRADMDGSVQCLPDCRNAEGLTLRLAVCNESGEELVCQETGAEESEILLQLEHPELWDCEHPALYRLKAVLKQGEKTVDERTVRFGFRRVEFRPDGFYLNEKRVQLRGLDRHQSWPYMGYAAPARAQRLDADILKYELGCNAVRTSHYPQSHHFINRCDEIGLLVFTEIPGWQHIGGESWKAQALENTREMVLQWRNHPSIFLWGVRINESADDDELYRKTNEIAHQLDPTRPTGGVRNFPHSHLLEDVYTYNDFSHHGPNRGCAPRKVITREGGKGYLISEYNGHMFPTKAYDCEEKRLEHALRHARVVSDAASQPGIGGSFGWCMFDYNTHRDFGSGDRICYHGVMDMFRNPKLAAAVYASQQEMTPVLEISSSMDIGEHPAGALGTVAVFTNADQIRLYRNDLLVGSFSPSADYAGLAHPPVLIEDTVSGLLERQEGMSPRTASMVREVLLATAMYGSALPLSVLLKAAYLMGIKGFTREQGVDLYNRYVASWGGQVARWRFEAVKNGQVVASTVRCPGDTLALEVCADTDTLTDGPSWDMATVRIRAVDEYGAVRTWCSRSLSLRAEGAVELIGPASVPLSGGMAGCYLRTRGEAGSGRLTIEMEGAAPVTLSFQVSKQEEERV
nr:glycoside hydrolase family 2 TIM barrel-domain containing protein [Fournierella massiliensis]